MSEYQYIHFLAIDRPLDDKQLAYMEKQSTRAHITRWKFTNEYHYGDFRGNAVEMLRRGYDVHLHFANFGIRKVMFRLPELPCDKERFTAFEDEYGVSWKKDKRGKAGVLSIDPEADACSYGYLDDVQSMLPRLAPLRELLLRGDLRPLYLTWLACACEDESLEPPVPAGLAKLDGALEALAEFYEISLDLVAAAAEQALPEPEQPDHDAVANQWIGHLTKHDLKRIVSDLATGNAANVQADLLGNIRQSTPSIHPASTRPTRTLEELRNVATSIKNKRSKGEAIACKRAREKHLKSIATNPKNLICRIDTLVAGRSRESYHQVADCLTDLAEALGEGAGRARSRQIAQRLRQRKPRSNVLIGILRKRGWID